ncbi:MAG: membrane protein insertion efficiency factor YidD [Firmicutes bacterium]|nr:membrane protein insertion efficiency factor YidD [Bacillota bacterium]
MLKKINAQHYIAAVQSGEFPTKAKFFWNTAIFRFLCALLVVGIPIGILNFILFFLSWPSITTTLNIIFASVFAFVSLLIYARYVPIFIIKIYQRFWDPERREQCCLTPSCSVYGILIIEKYGAWYGCIKTWIRLKNRCFNYLEQVEDWPYDIPEKGIIKGFRIIEEEAEEVQEETTEDIKS